MFVAQVSKIHHSNNLRDDTILLDDLNLFKLKKNTRGFTNHFKFNLFIAQPHPTRIYHHGVCTRQNRSVFTQGTRPLKDPTKFEKTTQEA